MDFFFAYGSLLETTGNTQVDKAVAAGEQIGRGYVHGKLYDLGTYPGALPVEVEGLEGPSQNAPKVWGTLMSFRDSDAFFAALDEYEGFRPDAPWESEYVRYPVPIFMQDSARVYIGQVYFYNQSVRNKPLIPSGDYLAFLRAQERPR